MKKTINFPFISPGRCAQMNSAADFKRKSPSIRLNGGSNLLVFHLSSCNATSQSNDVFDIYEICKHVNTRFNGNMYNHHYNSTKSPTLYGTARHFTFQKKMTQEFSEKNADNYTTSNSALTYQLSGLQCYLAESVNYNISNFIFFETNGRELNEKNSRNNLA